MNDGIGEEFHLGGVVTVTDQVLPVDGDIFGANDLFQFLDDSRIEHEYFL